MDKLQQLSGILCGVYMTANGTTDIANAQTYITRDTDIIFELSNRAHKWGNCDYVLHALIFALRKADLSAILAHMSKDNLKLLKDSFVAVQEYKCPDKEAASKINLEHIKLNKKPNISQYDKYKNNVARYAALIEIKVSENWWEVQEELNKWAATLGLAQKTETMSDTKNTVVQEQEVAPAPQSAPKEELWTMAELATKLGLKNVGVFHCKKSQFLKKNPQAKEKFSVWFKRTVQDKTRPLFKAKYFDELKQLMATPRKPVAPKPQKTKPIEPNGLWTIDELTQKLGLKNKMYFAKKKARFLKRHPDSRDKVQGWFSKNGSRFNPEHFDELKQMMMVRAKSPKKIVAKEPAPVAPTQPTELVGIKGLEAYLASLKGIYAQACEDKAIADTKYQDLQKRTQAAKETLDTAQKQVEELDTKITKINILLENYKRATDALAAAQTEMETQTNKINSFLQGKTL